MDANRSRHCDSCGGSGRAGTCNCCNGQTKVTCKGCGGCGTVGCVTCGQTGWLTVATTLGLTGKPFRATSFFPDAPPEFRAGVSALPVTELPVLHGKVVRSLVEEADGKVGLALECVIPHVTLEAQFAPAFTQRFDAIGLQCRVPVMPTFLDVMLEPLSKEIAHAAEERRFEDVLRFAKDSRLTCSVLLAVSGRDGHELGELRSLWKAAASDAFLDSFLGHVGQAYDGVGSAAVSGPWKLLALPVIAVAAAALPLHVARPLLTMASGGGSPDTGVEMLLDAGLGMLPFGLAFAFTARQARNAVRELVGLGKARTPRQGWWARGVGMAVLAALVGGAVATGKPPLPPVAASDTRVALLTTHSVGNGSVRMRLLGPGTLPRLAPVFSVLTTRGKPDVFRLQFYLRQLGFLQVPPDGVVHASTYDALEMFDDTLPATRKRVKLGPDAANVAAAALRGDFELQRLPVDRFPLPSLSNLARANLTGMDTEFMRRAASQALTSPGQEITWRSADGLHGGRLMATRLPTGCPLLQVEVDIRGATEAVGPFPFCTAQRP